MNNLKRVLLLLLVLTLAVASVFSLASCDNTDNGDDSGDGGKENKGDSVTYTVVVKDEAGNAISGATVSITYDGVEKVTKKATDENGKVTYTANAAAKVGVMATVNSVPTGYKKPAVSKNIEFASGSDTLTVVVESLDTYTVTVKDQNGDAVSGIKIQLCFGEELCLKAESANSEGKVVFYYGDTEEVATAKIYELPSGYSYAKDGIFDLVAFDFEEGSYEIEISVVKD